MDPNTQRWTAGKKTDLVLSVLKQEKTLVDVCREEDARSLRRRWERENTPKTNRPSEPPAIDAETELLHRLVATMVQIRHPAAYDGIVEHSA